MASKTVRGPQFVRYFDPVIAALKKLGGSGTPSEVKDVVAEIVGVSETEQYSDGGIDGIGILQMNPFVSFKVLFQCKRYGGAVNASQVRDFRGAMMGRADKGIIMTTGSFTADANKEAVCDGVPPLELVDGEKLVDMFESLELGLKPRKAYDVDPQFFEEFS